MLFSLENKLNIRNYQSGPLGAYNIPDIQAIQLQYLLPTDLPMPCPTWHPSLISVILKVKINPRL